MAAIISIALFLVLGAVIVLYGRKAYVKPARFFEQLLPHRAAAKAGAGAGPGGARVAVHVIEQIGSSVPISKEDSTLARRSLVAAGFRSERSVAVYYGAKVALGIILLVAALLVLPHIKMRTVARIFLFGASAGGGYFAPSLMVERMIARRQRKLRIGLPDALDLMVIAVESGLGIDQAFVSVTRELRTTHKDVTDEFSLVTLEMRAGTRRIDALHNLASRTGEPEVRKLVAVLAQTDRFGTSVADALRTHADFMRVTRRLSAEEKAGKLGVKLIFPIFFLIMPSIVLVVAGPGMLQVIKVLMPAMSNIK